MAITSNFPPNYDPENRGQRGDAPVVRLRSGQNVIEGRNVQAPTSTPTPMSGARPAGTAPHNLGFRQAEVADTLRRGLGQQSPVDPWETLLSDRQAIEQAYSYMEGGASGSTLASLAAQKRQAEQQYQTNTATASNLYGQLSMDEKKESTGLIGDIQQMSKQLDEMYASSISGSQATSAKRQADLAATQTAQDAQRAKVAEGLGLGLESLKSDYESDTALNTAMGDVLATSANWEGLLASQKLGAQESGKRQVTATANTLNQVLLGMQERLDQTNAAIDAQIASERSKSPTRKLSDIGRLLLEANTNEIKDYLNPKDPARYSENPIIAKQQQAMESLNLNPSSPADKARFDSLVASAQKKMQNRAVGKSEPLTRQEQTALQAIGSPQYYYYQDPSVYED